MSNDSSVGDYSRGGDNVHMPIPDNRTTSTTSDNSKLIWRPYNLNAIYRDLADKDMSDFNNRARLIRWMGKGRVARDISNHIGARAAHLAYAKLYKAFLDEFKDDNKKLYDDQGKNRKKIKRVIVDWCVEFAKNTDNNIYRTMIKEFGYREGETDEKTINEWFNAFIPFLKDLMGFAVDEEGTPMSDWLQKAPDSYTNNPVKTAGHFLADAYKNFADANLGRSVFGYVKKKAFEVARAGTHDHDWAKYMLDLVKDRDYKMPYPSIFWKAGFDKYLALLNHIEGDPVPEGFELETVGLAPKEMMADRSWSNPQKVDSIDDVVGHA